MLQHDFSKQDNRALIFLRNSLQRTMNNPKCEMLQTPVSNTLKQLEKEMQGRGLTLNIKTEK